MPEKKDLDKVRELFQRVQDSITTAKAQEEGVEVSSKVLFVVDKRFWYFDRDKDVWLMDQPYSPEKAKSMAFDCAVYTDAQTMIALSMDRLKPMSAFLSGKLKMEGDRKSFLAIAPYLKQSMRTESTATAPIEVQIIGTVVESSTGETYLSRHSIGGDEDDEDDEDRPVGGTRKSVTKYILRVNDSICQEQWELLHRFSDFIRLKKDLEKEGYKAIPKVKGKSSIFKSQDVLVKERIAHLNLFLHQLVSLIGTDSTVLNNFLGNSARGLLKSTAQKSSDLHSELTRKETMTSIRNHANRPISWNKKSVLRDTNLVNEIATAKKKVDDLQRVVEGSDKADGGILLYVSAVIRQFVLFVLVFSTCFRLLMESDVHPVGDALLTFQVCCILIALIMKEARYYTFLYIFISVLSLGNEKSYSFFKWLAVFLKHALALFSSRIAGGISVNQFDVFRLSSVGWQGFLSFVSSILFILQNECYSTTLKVGCMFYYCITSFWGGSAVAVVMYIYILLQKHYARIQIILLGDVTSKKKLLSEAESGLVERANDSVDDPAVSNFMREISLLRYRIQGLRLRRTSSILSYLYPFSSYTVAFIVVRLAHNPSNTWLSIQLGLLFSTLLICFLRKETKISLILSYFLSVVLITCSSDLESLFHTFISDINKSTDTAISEISAKVSSYQLNTTTIVEMLSDTYLNLGVVANKVAFLLLEDFKGSRNLLIYLAALGFLLMLSNSYYRRMIRIYIMGTWLVAFYATLAIVMSILRLSDAKKTVVYDLIDPVVAPFVSYNISQFRSIFLKFAQYLGGRVDVMSEHWTHAFSKLHDSCPPSSRSYVKKLIEGELGVGVEDIFESFDWNPMASASIGQAHCATIRSSTITELFSNRKDLLVDSRGKCQNFDLQEYLNYTMAEFGIRRDDPFFQVKKKVEVDSNDNKIISVVVKVQHENIANIMNSDMRIVIFFVQIAASLDSRWKILLDLLYTWQSTMEDELDFNVESSNLISVRNIMRDAPFEVGVPAPFLPFTTSKVLVMTRLFGYKLTDQTALKIHAVDRSLLVTRLAHSCAWQLLVAGVFNADPHAGNVMFCVSRDPFASSKGFKDEIIPGLLDFGMTVRLSTERRIAYCKLVLALFEGDFAAAGEALRSIGYKNNQSDRAPERDAEFFEFLFRDASTKEQAMKESSAFSQKRKDQKAEDVQKGVREKGGRQMAEVPDDFLFLTRVIGLLRGLTAELDCSCPIMYVLAQHAKIGLHSE